MLKIFTVNSRTQRHLVIEGALMEPWLAELQTAWQTAKADLHERKLVLDLKNVTRIEKDGELALLKLMGEGACFSLSGVLTKHVLRQLARECAKSACAPIKALTLDAEKGRK